MSVVPIFSKFLVINPTQSESFGENRSFHRNRGVTLFDCRDRRPRRSAPLNAPNRQYPNIVGEGFPLPFVLVKPFVHGGRPMVAPTEYGGNRLNVLYYSFGTTSTIIFPTMPVKSCASAENLPCDFIGTARDIFFLSIVIP